MSVLSFVTQDDPVVVALVTVLPGPDRKRTASPYSYRLTYRNPDSQADGCVMVWEVQGGRAAYQIAVERHGADRLRVHCTCADAIYRGENEGHVCKHVTGFLRVGRRLQEQAEALRTALRPAS
jgi:hypothetical protein